MQVNAGLNLIGQGTSVHGTYNLIYDTDLDITWYDYRMGPNLWQNQVDWADALSVSFGSNVYDDWRLPIVFDQNCLGANCTNSEFGHLYYTELGNEELPIYINTGDFQNLTGSDYWTGTEFTALSYKAFNFDFLFGLQGADTKNSAYKSALAVRSGLAVVPEPVSSALFFTGGTLLAGWRYMKRKNRA